VAAFAWRPPITSAALWTATACTLPTKCLSSNKSAAKLVARISPRSSGSSKVSRAVTAPSTPPRRLPRTSSLYQKLSAEPVQTELKARHHSFSLTLLTADRPALFATISGVLAGWGMNIVKADAFANAAGVVLDTFQFVRSASHAGAESSEIARFQKNLADIVNAKAPLEPLLKSREIASKAKPLKVPVETRIGYDDMSSAQAPCWKSWRRTARACCMTSARPRRLGCNIDVALIDTEGQKAIDVSTDGARKETQPAEARIASRSPAKHALVKSFRISG